MLDAVGVRQQQLQQRGGLHHMNGEKKQNKAVVKDIGQIGGKYIKAKGPSHGWRQRRLDYRNSEYISSKKLFSALPILGDGKSHMSLMTF